MTKKEEFKRKGYIVIKNAFKKEEITNIRNLCLEAFNEKELKGSSKQTNSVRDRQLFTKELIKKPKLINPLFNKKIIDEVREVFGDDYITFAYFSLSNNLHSPIWHTDRQSFGYSNKIVYDPSFNVAKLGFYPQEDDKTFAGQLDVIPGSHLPTFLGVKSPISTKIRRGKVSILQLLAMRIRNKLLGKISIKISPCDVILFHGLLLHRSSQPDWNKVNQIDGYGIESPPDEKRKFMFQWEVAENNEFANLYANHQSQKQEDIYKESTETSLEDFHDSTKSIIHSNNINIKGYSELKLI